MGTETADVRAGFHRIWAGVAGAWGEHSEYVDEHAAPMTGRMLDLAGLKPGERVLELACGAGGLGLAAAARVAPGGEVVVSDVVAEMTEIAALRARAQGLTNVRSRPLDIEHIDEPDAAYDAVLCREGFMFAFEPERAAGEVLRVLRPGGRFAVSVWGPRERNPWLGMVLDAASAELGVELPPPGLPGPFALSDAARLRAVLEEGGLGNVTIEEFEVPRRTASAEEWWLRTSALAGPLAKRLESLPQEARDAVRARAEEAVRPYVTGGGGLEFPGVALIASGRRADG